MAFQASYAPGERTWTATCSWPLGGFDLHDPRGCDCGRAVHPCGICGRPCKGAACSDDHASRLYYAAQAAGAVR